MTKTDQKIIRAVLERTALLYNKREVRIGDTTDVFLHGIRCCSISDKVVTIYPEDTRPTKKSSTTLNAILGTLTEYRVSVRRQRWYLSPKEKKEGVKAVCISPRDGQKGASSHFGVPVSSVRS